MTMTETPKLLTGIALIKEIAMQRRSGWVFDQKTLEHARDAIEKNPDNGRRARETLEMFGHLPQNLRESVTEGKESIHVDINGNMIINKLP